MPLKSEIQSNFSTDPPKTYKEANERIKTIYGISLSESAVRMFMIKHECKKGISSYSFLNSTIVGITVSISNIVKRHNNKIGDRD